MRVRDRMERDVITVTPQTSVLNARRLMDAYGIRHLPVVDRGDLVGIISERDVRVSDADLVRGLGGLQSDLLWGRYRPVSAVMHDPVHVIHPADPLAAAAQLLADTRAGALPVVEAGELVGILSVIDCLDALAELETAAATEPSGARERSPHGTNDPSVRLPGIPAYVLTTDQEARA